MGKGCAPRVQISLYGESLPSWLLLQQEFPLIPQGSLGQFKRQRRLEAGESASVTSNGLLFLKNISKDDTMKFSPLFSIESVGIIMTQGKLFEGAVGASWDNLSLRLIMCQSEKKEECRESSQTLFWGGKKKHTEMTEKNRGFTGNETITL